jgi:hypothetical protein
VRAPLLAIVLLGVLATMSKTAALALSLAVVIQQAIDPTRTRARILILLALVVVVASRSLALCLGSDIGAMTLLGSRTETVPEGLSQLLSAPGTLLFGYGYGSQLAIGGDNLVETDSIASTVALEGGFVGLNAFVAMISLAVAVVIRAQREMPTAVTSALSGYCIFFLLYSPVAGNFRMFPGVLLFWISVGFAATTVALRPAERWR